MVLWWLVFVGTFEKLHIFKQCRWELLSDVNCFQRNQLNFSCLRPFLACVLDELLFPAVILSLISKEKGVFPLVQKVWRLWISIRFMSSWNIFSYYLSYLVMSCLIHFSQNLGGCKYARSPISYSTVLSKQLDLHTDSRGNGEGYEPSCSTGSWALSRHIPAESTGIWMREGLDILILD